MDMQIDILTLFPESVDAMLNVSILGRAQERGYIAIRTHQIRATMAEIGHPLVGEGKYSSMKNDLGFRFQALCAWSLTFRFEGDSAPLDYLNGRTFTVGEDPFARYLRDRK